MEQLEQEQEYEQEHLLTTEEIEILKKKSDKLYNQCGFKLKGSEVLSLSVKRSRAIWMKYLR